MRNFLKNKKFIVYITFIAAILFSVRFTIFFLPHQWQQSFSDGTILGFFLAVSEHLFILPVMWFLPTPRWCKLLGSLWVVNDIITDILAIAGISASIFLIERYWGHLLLAAPWFFTVGSFIKGKKTQWLAWITGFFLALYTLLFVLFHTPGIVLFPVALSLPSWLLLIGFRLKNNKLSKEI